MKRRDFLSTLAASAAALWPAVGHAQEKLIPVIGVLIPAAQQPAGFIDAFREGLQSLGYTEGLSLQLDVKSAEGRLDQLPGLATEIVAARPEPVSCAWRVIRRCSRSAS